MKKQILLAIAAGALAMGAAHAGDADFTMANRTGYDIREVYISASHRNNWGNDRMGDGVLENGKSKLFRFTDKAACKQDLMVVFDDDGSKVTGSVTLADIQDIVKPDVKDRKQVELTVDIECGTT